MKKNLAIGVLIYFLANASVMAYDQLKEIRELKRLQHNSRIDYNTMHRIAAYYQKIIIDNEIQIDDFDEIALNTIVGK